MARNVKNTQQLSEAHDNFDDAFQLDASDLLDPSSEVVNTESVENLEAQISLAIEELSRENDEALGQSIQINRGTNETDDFVVEDEDFSMAFEENTAPSGYSHSPSISAEADNAHSSSAQKTRPVDISPTTSSTRAANAIPFSAANDDQRGILSSSFLGKSAPRTIYWAALAVSALWFLSFLFIGNRLYGDQISQLGSFFDFARSPQLSALLLAAILPIVLFWGFAVMVRRAQEMRLASQQMAEVAFRLLAPENVAQERVMTISQAVRREVQAMGEGIERTLARAIELETLVQTEVNELERAYSENESRIRVLVDSLGTEREGIIGHAERVRSSISESHAVLKNELESAGDHIRGSVDKASQMLSSSLGQSGVEILKRIATTGQGIQASLQTKADILAKNMNLSNEELANLLDNRISQLSTTVKNYVQQIDNATGSVSQVIDIRGEKLASQLISTSSNLTELLDSRIASLSENTDGFISRLDVTTNAIAKTFEERTENLAERLATSGDAVAHLLESRVASLDESTLNFVGRLETSTHAVADVLDQRAAALEQRLTNSGLGVAKVLESSIISLNTNSDTFVDRLETTTNRVADVLDQRSEAIQQRFASSGAGVVKQIATSITSLEETTDGFMDRLSDSAHSITTAINQHADTIEHRLSNSGATISSILESSIGSLDEKTLGIVDKIETSTSGINKALTHSAELIAKSMSSTGTEVAQVIATSLSSIDYKAEGIVNRLSASTGEISNTLSQHADAIEHRLTSTGEGLSRILETSFDNVDVRTAGLVSKVEASSKSISSALEERAFALEQHLTSSGEGVVRVLGDTFTSIDAKTQGLVDKLISTTSSVTEALDVGTDNIEQRITLSGQAVTRVLNDSFSSIDDQTQGLVDRLASSTLDVTAALAQRADDIEQRIAISGQAVTRLFDTRLDTLDQQTSNFTNRLGDTADSITRALQDGSDLVAQNFAASSETLAHSLEQRMGSIGKQTEGLIHSLENATGATAGAFREQSEYLTQKITESGAHVADVLDTRISSFTNQMQNASNSLDEVFKSSTSNLLNSLEHTTDRVSVEFEDRIDRMQNRINEGGRDLLDSMDGRTDAFETSIQRLDTALESRTRSLNDSLAARAREVADTFTHGHDQVISSINQGQDQFAAAIAQGQNELATSISDRQQQFISALSKGQNELADSIAQGQEQVLATIETGKKVIGHELSDLVSSTSAMIDNRADDFIKAIEDGHIRVGARIEEDLSKFTAAQANVERSLQNQLGSFIETQDSIAGQIETGLQRFDEVREGFTNRIYTEIDRLAETRSVLSDAISDDLAKIGTEREHLSNSIRSELGQVGDTFNKQIGMLEERTRTMESALEIGVDRVKTTLENSAVYAAGALREKVLEATHTLGEEAAKVLHDVDGHMTVSVDHLSAKFGEKINALDHTLDAAGQRMTARAEQLGSHYDNIDSRMMQRVAESAAALEGHKESFTQVFSQADEQLRARTLDTANLLYSQVEGFAAAYEKIDERIVDRAYNTTNQLNVQADAIVDRLAQVEERMRTTADTASSDLINASTEAERALGDTFNRTAVQLQDGVVQIEEHLRAGTEQAVNQVGEQIARSQADFVSAADTISQAFNSVNEHISLRTGEAVRTLEERTHDLNSVLASRSVELSRILDETARPLVERFEAGGSELQRAIEDVTESTSERLQQQNAALISALTSRTADTLNAVERVRNNITGEVASLLDQLTTSSDTLNDMVQNAARNMLDADEKLSLTATAFASNTERTAESFSNSASLLNANSGRLSDLSDRTLNSLTGIASRFEDHSRVLEQASHLLDQAQNGILSSLGGREDALRALADGLVLKSEQIEDVIRSFDGLIEGMLTKTEQRSRTSVDTIRNAMEEVVESATTRFAGATDDIRRTATEVRAELEKTRADLKRGVVEIPEEAKQSTTAMRRAITEQISALKELSSIVSKTGRIQETPVQRPVVASTPPLRPAMPQMSQAPSAPMRAPAGTRVMDRPVVAQRPARTMERPAPVSKAPDNGGWIKDLLRSASHDEQAARPRQAPSRNAEPQVSDSLSSLSQEIARAIDNDAAGDLWERYGRGERNVFTRRLYTLKGQQTFDNIQRKYNADPAFKQAVDLFCRDFERLLTDISRDSNAPAVTQSYLTSETGKVYTLLAHASGRLR